MTSVLKSRIVQALGPRARIARVIVAVAFAGLFTASCDNKITDSGTLLTLTVSPISATLAVNGTQQFTAGGTDATGSVTLKGQTWSVVAGGGTISSSGLFTAGTVAGTFTNTVKVTCGGRDAFATVIVSPGALLTITVTPNPATLAIGATQQFTAVGKDANNNVVAITPVWSTVNPPGSIIASTGLFTAGTVAGTFPNTVRATQGAIFGTATVIVTIGPLLTITVTPNPDTLAIGATQQFTAVGRDAGGNVVAITPVWSTVNPPGSINATGLFTAGTVAGSFPNTVRATQGAIFGTATVVVTPGPLLTITVTPNPDTLAIGATQQFTAVGKDANNNVVAITPVWSTVNPPGSINATGLFTAGNTIGSFPNTVRATQGAIFGTATVVVTPGPLLTIAVTPQSTTLNPGGTQQFAAVGRDAGGNVVAITPVWSVRSPNDGSINSVTGLFTAGPTIGSFPNTVRAAVGAIFDEADVIVIAATPSLGILGSASVVGILAGSTVTCVTGGVVNADIDIYAGSALVGFGPCVLTGVTHLADAVAQQAQADVLVAYNMLMNLPCGTVIGTASIGGGTTLPAGVYCSPSTIDVTGNLTLDGGGDPNAKFVFQAGSSLTGVGNIILIGGAQAKNVYWVNGAAATIGVSSAWQGNILAYSSITLNDNVTLLGRALTRIGAVTLGNNNVITLP